MSIRSERIKSLIEQSNLSYVELEKLTGIKKSSLQRYASGVTSKIPLEVIEKLSKAFRVSQQYLMGWEEVQQKNSTLADLTIRMRSDDKFASFVEKAAKLTPEKLSSLEQLLDVLLQG